MKRLVCFLLAVGMLLSLAAEGWAVTLVLDGEPGCR